MKHFLLSCLFTLFFIAGEAQWESISSYPAGDVYSVSSCVVDGKAYCGGGNPEIRFFYEYSPEDDSWQPLLKLPPGIPRSSPILFSIDGKVYMGGGANLGMPVGPSFYVYDRDAGTWSQKGDFSGGDIAQGFYTSLNGKGYVFGGTDGSNPKAEVWEYDPGNDAWTQKGDLPMGGNQWPAGFVIDGEIYLGTGRTGNGITDFYKYSPANDSWEQLADFPGEPRWNATGFAVDGKGYIGGGWSDDNTTAYPDFYQYDPQTDAWTEMTELAFPNPSVAFMTSFVIDDHVYCGTGLSDAFASTDKFYKYKLGADSTSDTSTAIHSLQGQPLRMHIYPNPASDQVYVELQGELQGNLTFRIRDIQGRVVKEVMVKDVRGNIDISGLNSGLYFVEVPVHGANIIRSKITVR